MSVKSDKPAEWYPSNPWPLLAALAVVGVGAVLAGLGFWRVAALTIAAGLGLAGVLRLVLPRRIAGLLVVRRRGFDVTVLGAMAVALAVVATLVPPGS